MEDNRNHRKTSQRLIEAVRKHHDQTLVLAATGMAVLVVLSLIAGGLRPLTVILGSRLSSLIHLSTPAKTRTVSGNAQNG